MSSTNEIGWFEELSKQIDEKAVIAMMVLVKARNVSKLMASGANDPDAYAEAIFPHVLSTLTAMVASQVNCEAVKADFCNAEQMRQQKAAINEALRRGPQAEQQAREQLFRSWGQR